MALVGSYTIKLKAGDDGELFITWVDENDSPIDLTGFTALMEIRKSPADVVALSVVGVIASPANGEIVFPFTAAETSGLIIDGVTTCYVYDVEMTSSAPAVTTILKGVARVEQDVTQ